MAHLQVGVEVPEDNMLDYCVLCFKCRIRICILSGMGAVISIILLWVFHFQDKWYTSRPFVWVEVCMDVWEFENIDLIDLINEF